MSPESGDSSLEPTTLLDEKWDDFTLAGVTIDETLGSRAIIMSMAREQRAHRERIISLSNELSLQRRRLRLAGSVLATVVALASALGQHLPAWVISLFGG